MAKLVDNFCTVKAKFDYAIWFEPASNQLRTSQRNGIWLLLELMCTNHAIKELANTNMYAHKAYGQLGPIQYNA